MYSFIKIYNKPKYNKPKKDYIIIGSRNYKNIHLNAILDTFQKNMRCNMNLAGHNNGTKIDEHILNAHVYDYKFKRKNNNYENLFDKKYIQEFNSFDKSKWSKVYKQDYTATSKFNHYLRRNKCHQFKSNVMRVGYNGIWNILKSGQYNIFVHGFSIIGDDPKRGLLNNEKNTSSCHDIISEQKCLVDLHNKNIIDATMCCLLDKETPYFDCKIIIPKPPVLLLFLKHFNSIKLVNLNNPKSITSLKNELYRKSQKKISWKEQPDISTITFYSLKI